MQVSPPASRWNNFIRGSRTSDDYARNLLSLTDKMKDRIAKYLIRRAIDEDIVDEDTMRELLFEMNVFEGMWETEWSPRFGWFFCEGECNRAEHVLARYGEFYPDVSQ